MSNICFNGFMTWSLSDYLVFFPFLLLILHVTYNLLFITLSNSAVPLLQPLHYSSTAIPLIFQVEINTEIINSILNWAETLVTSLRSSIGGGSCMQWQTFRNNFHFSFTINVWHSEFTYDLKRWILKENFLKFSENISLFSELGETSFAVCQVRLLRKNHTPLPFIFSPLKAYIYT